ncbi:vWA domain-containing protein [Priestia megaterium]|uniref:vWA domain-containing protein n=1 Tax=Priestia megaterium TaxID=1404 RepID=UPI003242A76D
MVKREDKTLENFQAIDIWHLLNHRFGLHFRKEGGRDNQLYNKLKENLCCPKELGIGKFLRLNPQITALRFIQALLGVTEPFSNMYKDIFTTMKEFSVKEAYEAILIRYELENEQIEFNLDHFKEFLKVESLVRQVIQQRVWSPQFVNEIPHFFKVLTNNSIVIERHPVLTDVLEQPPTYSDPKLNEYLFEVYNLLLEIKTHRLGEGLWLGAYNLAKPFYDEFTSKDFSLNIKEATAAYEEIFSRLDSEDVEVEVLIEKFIEYLNLPFWKNRWYVYEVWITLRTVKALENFNIKLNVQSDGVLPLSSGRYSHVGTFIDEKNQEYTLHAQLQTSVEGFEKRKGMEPDLRIIEGHNVESDFTKIIIECKQRIEMNKEQLEKNIELYEYGASNSHNIFVNYDLFPNIQKDKFKRTQLISNVRPNNIGEFYKVLNKLLLTYDIIPKRSKDNYNALLLDSSASMDGYLTYDVKDKLLAILDEIDVDNYFYFNSDLIESVYNTPKSLIDNVTPKGGTNLKCALETLMKKYTDVKSVIIITDQDPSLYSSEVREQFNKIHELNILEINK